MTFGTVKQVQKDKSLMDKNVWGGPCFLNNIVNLEEFQSVCSSRVPKTL